MQTAQTFEAALPLPVYGTERRDRIRSTSEMINWARADARRADTVGERRSPAPAQICKAAPAPSLRRSILLAAGRSAFLSIGVAGVALMVGPSPATASGSMSAYVQPVAQPATMASATLELRGPMTPSVESSF